MSDVDDLLAKMESEKTVLLDVERVTLRIRNPPRASGQTYAEWEDARAKVWPIDDVVPEGLQGRRSPGPVDKEAVFGTVEDQTSDAWGLMTESQRRAVMSLVRGILERDAHTTDDLAEFPIGYEYKVLTITHRGRGRRGGRGDVWIYATVGMVGDEGTMAAALCRVTRHISVSPRGRIELHNRARYVGKPGDEKNPLRKVSAARGRGLWSAIHEPTT